MKTILKSMVALSLVSSVAFGAELYNVNKAKMMKVELENNATIKEAEKDYQVKFKYSKDEKGKENIIATLQNGETAIIESMGYDEEDLIIVAIKNNKIGQLTSSCKKYKECFVELATPKFMDILMKLDHDEKLTIDEKEYFDKYKKRIKKLKLAEAYSKYLDD